MSDYLTSLVARTFRPEGSITPRVRSSFEPAAHPDLAAPPEAADARAVLFSTDPPPHAEATPRKTVSPERGISTISAGPPPITVERSGSRRLVFAEPPSSTPTPAVPDPISPGAHVPTSAAPATAPVVPGIVRPKTHRPVGGVERTPPDPGSSGEIAPVVPVELRPEPRSDTSDSVSAASQLLAIDVAAQTRRADERNTKVESGTVPARPPEIRPAEAAAPWLREPDTPRRSADGPPTIRVTIGRVEVRAVPPPARSALKPIQLRRPILSLDEYLERRDAGRL